MSSSHDSETRRAALEKAQKGRRLLSARDYEGAAAALTEAIALAPNVITSYRNRAEAYTRLKMMEKARADWEMMGSLERGGLQRTQAAALVVSEEQHREALEKALEGWRLLGVGDYECAIAACTEAIVLNPRILGAYRTRAEAYERLGRKQAAQADLVHVAKRQKVAQPTGPANEEITEWSWTGLIWAIAQGLIGIEDLGERGDEN